MKKIFVILALMGMLMGTVGCGCRQTTSTEPSVDETEVVVDTVDAVDTTLVLTEAE